MDFEGVAKRLKRAMKSLFDDDKSNSGYSLVIETDFDHEKYKCKSDEKDPKTNGYRDFCDATDILNCQVVKKEIETAIKESCDKLINYSMIFPTDLMSHISQDIIRMSVAEPCGVDGCVLYVMLQEKDQCHKLTTIFGNPATPPTFEIYLTLREDNRSWKKFQKIFITLKGCILNTRWTSSMPKILCSAYQLEKRRLYRLTN